MESRRRGSDRRFEGVVTSNDTTTPIDSAVGNELLRYNAGATLSGHERWKQAFRQRQTLWR